MTHVELVDRAAKWLRNSCNCKVVAAELVTYTMSGETPDTIGWEGARSIIVECKTSRSDFFADRKRPARIGYRAMGEWRIYLTPPGLLSPSEIPDGWGLYEVHEKSIRFAGGIKYDRRHPPFLNPDRESEIVMLLSIIRRSYNWHKPIITTNGVNIKEKKNVSKDR